MQCLNPYYTGSYSMRLESTWSCRWDLVLILIILEVTLWASWLFSFVTSYQRLNPYYTGSYSMSYLLVIQLTLAKQVLILIILEVTLWGGITMKKNVRDYVLILIILEVTLWEKEYENRKFTKTRVLILIILEVTLWEYDR